MGSKLRMEDARMFYAPVSQLSGDEVQTYSVTVEAENLMINELCVTQDDIADMPTIDAVEVVRCKDCRHCVGDRCRRNAGLNDWRRNDDFCSFGERKTDV